MRCFLSSFQGFGSCAFPEIDIPDSVVSIKGYAFKGCKNLGEITLPDGLEELGFEAFGECENVKVTYKGKTYGYDELDELAKLFE